MLFKVLRMNELAFFGHGIRFLVDFDEFFVFWEIRRDDRDGRLRRFRRNVHQFPKKLGRDDDLVPAFQKHFSVSLRYCFFYISSDYISDFVAAFFRHCSFDFKRVVHKNFNEINLQNNS